MCKSLELGEWQRNHDLNDPFIPQPYLKRLLIIKVFQTWGGFSVGISVSEFSKKAAFCRVLGCRGYHPGWHTCYGRTLLLSYAQLRMCFRIHHPLKPLGSDVKLSILTLLFSLSVVRTVLHRAKHSPNSTGAFLCQRGCNGKLSSQSQREERRWQTWARHTRRWL